MRKHWRRAAALFAAFAVVALLLTMAACSSTDDASTDTGDETTEAKGTVVIGSKIDTEGELLASIIGQLLEDNGFEVDDKSQTGTTDVVRKALLTGEIDIYPEYTGSGLIFFEDQDPETYKDPQAGYDAVKELDAEENDVIWLTPARANNTWAIAVKTDFAEGEGVVTMSDMAQYVNDGGEAKLAASDEFFNNAEAFPSFAETYGFDLTDDQKVILAGGNTSQTEKAVADGTDGVNFGMAYGTDGALADLGLTVLEDDQGAQPAYWPTPIIRGEVLTEYPEIEDILTPAFDALTLEKLQELNARIQVNGEAADAVAEDFLSTGGFLAE